MWLGLDSGIAYLNTQAPFRVYNDFDGKIGSVYAAASHKGFLYLGTNQGLFVKQENTSNTFQLIKNTEGQVWALDLIGDTLFCGHNAGTFIVEGLQANKISAVNGAWKTRVIPGKSDSLVQGTYNGLHLFVKQDGRWKYQHKIQGFDISSRYFDFQSPTEIFVSHEYKGVFKLDIESTYSNIINVHKTPLSKGANAGLIRYQDKILYAIKDGIYAYNSNQEEFVKDTLFSKVFLENTYTSGKLIADASLKLWWFSKNAILFSTPGKFSTAPDIDSLSVSQQFRNPVVGYESLIEIGANKYLLGTSNGFLELDMKQEEKKISEIRLNKVQVSNKQNQIKVLPLNNEVTELKNKENDISFSYSTPFFEVYKTVKYQYKLTGLYPNWSAPTTTSSASFKNLPYGNYTFVVRAKVGGQTTAEKAYTFTIARPWYLSYTALSVYSISLVLLIVSVNGTYKRYYRKKQAKALEKTQRELALKELENTQQLMRFNNEKLKQDIENKSRELAISTMSLVKNNEFLSEIKAHLQKGNKQDLNEVVQIIDKKINSTDDWKLFEEAFTNVDKAFLKDIKTKHPELTSNDLRLCAYLRLNLSSKEIGPLLNISHRSVEVKRYRLRKKLNLERDTSLSSYILSI